MITFFTGENSFEIDRALQKLVAGFDGRPERIDGSALEVRHIPDLLMGATLFADKRLVIIKDLSENSAVWATFGDWVPRISDDISVVIVETKPDKRTKTYKALQKVTKPVEFPLWTDRDTAKAEQWATQEAKTLGFALDRANAALLVARVGVDQWQLFHALEKLAEVDAVTPTIIEDIIEANPTENVFYLFEAALRGNGTKVHSMIETLERTDDPYRLFGLLSGQAFHLAALAASGHSSAEVAKDLGAHPFALGKLVSFAERLGRHGAREVIAAFAEADAGMKTSAADPWLLIERALIKVTRTVRS